MMTNKENVRSIHKATHTLTSQTFTKITPWGPNFGGNPFKRGVKVIGFF